MLSFNEIQQNFWRLEKVYQRNTSIFFNQNFDESIEFIGTNIVSLCSVQMFVHSSIAYGIYDWQTIEINKSNYQLLMETYVGISVCLCYPSQQLLNLWVMFLPMLKQNPEAENSITQQVLHIIYWVSLKIWKPGHPIFFIQNLHVDLFRCRKIAQLPWNVRSSPENA